MKKQKTVYMNPSRGLEWLDFIHWKYFLQTRDHGYQQPSFLSLTLRTVGIPWEYSIIKFGASIVPNKLNYWGKKNFRKSPINNKV